MIITNICLLLEAISIVVCLHHLYGEKFKLDIETVSFLSIDMILMTVINYYGLPKTYTMVIYPILVLYCGARFGFRLKSMVVNLLLCIVLVGGIQLAIVPMFSFVFDTTLFSDINLLLMNCTASLIIIFLLPLCRVRKLSKFLQERERILLISVSVCVLIIFYWLICYKELKWIEVYQAILLFVSIVFIFGLATKVTKYKVKAKEIETELKMNKLYSDSFRGLIDHIRLRQHEFDNHINTVYSQHYMHKNYEDLIKAQKSYCEVIMKENRFNKLLSGGNPIIIGFLYGKFVEIEKLGIEVSYKVVGVEDELDVPVHKIVEILGDLINNAVEALLADKERNKLYVSVIGANGLYIEVRNESAHISYEELGRFFAKDYSQKGENRGLGLYNVKQICDEYHMEISCDNKEVDGLNWLYFAIRKEKETI